MFGKRPSGLDNAEPLVRRLSVAPLGQSPRPLHTGTMLCCKPVPILHSAPRCIGAGEGPAAVPCYHCGTLCFLIIFRQVRMASCPNRLSRIAVEGAFVSHQTPFEGGPRGEKRGGGEHQAIIYACPVLSAECWG